MGWRPRRCGSRWDGRSPARRCRGRDSGALTTLVRPIESTSNTAVASGIVADSRWIAGDEQHVAHAHRVRAEQVGLHPEQVTIAAGVMEDRFHPRLLHQMRSRQRAHTAASPADHPGCSRDRRRGCAAAAPARPATRRDGRAAAEARRRRRTCPARGCSPSATSRVADRDRHVRRRPAGCDRSSPTRPASTPAAGVQGAHSRLDLPDVLRRRAAAAANQPHAAVDESARVRRHVLGRAEIDVPSLDLARAAGVRLRRQLHGRDPAPSARSCRASRPGQHCS